MTNDFTDDTVSVVGAEHFLREGVLTVDGINHELLDNRLTRAIAGQLPQVLAEIGGAPGADLWLVAGIAGWFVRQLASDDSVLGIGMRQMAARAALDVLPEADKQLLAPGDDSELASMLAQRAQQLLDALASCPGAPVHDDAQGWAAYDLNGMLTWASKASEPGEPGEPGEAAFMAWLRVLSDAFARTGAAGVEVAEAVRSHTIEAARRDFLPKDSAAYPRWALAMCHCLWRDVLLPRKRKPASLVRPVMQGVVELQSLGPAYRKDTQQLLLARNQIVSNVEAMGATLDEQLLERGLLSTGTKTAHLLFRHLILTSHDARLAGHPDSHIIEADGWPALARIVRPDISGKQIEAHAKEVRALVYAMAHYRFNLPDKSVGNLLSYTERESRGRGGKAHVTISLGAPLLAGYVDELEQKLGGPRSHDAREARKLVPYPRQLPPLYGRSNEHGSQISCALATMAHIRQQARRLADEGSFEMAPDDFTRLADRAQLPRRVHDAVLAVWLQGTSTAAPFLRRLEADRFDLGEAYQAERAYIEAAGRKEALGARAGKAAAKQRGGMAANGFRGSRKAKDVLSPTSNRLYPPSLSVENFSLRPVS